MRLANVLWQGSPRIARVGPEGQVAVLPAVIGHVTLLSIDDAVRWWNDDLAHAIVDVPPEIVTAPERVRFRPVVERPGKILGVGLNYRRHAEEMGMTLPETPQFFTKFRNALAAHGDDIPLPPETQAVDYEAELAVVIGVGGRRLSEEEALQAVFGYTAANDISARDLLEQSSQWILGKSLDRFCPVGPFVATRDEVPDPQALTLSLRWNGALCQRASTSDMIFPVAALISYASRYWPLEPGDLLLTGTPPGVIRGLPPEQRRWLAPGDITVVELEGLTALRNRFVEPGATA
jgi:2-keto-4-pentenoate hydratase/2-oxohepta-3-ene-1,7-dioic acid hydratase in catechol pathway